MNLTSLSCDHPTKSIKLIIDGGMEETFSLILCNSCRIQYNPKYIIMEKKIELNYKENDVATVIAPRTKPRGRINEHSVI